MGPMTGRGAGFCAGYNTPGFMNPSFGRGFGMGAGRGFGTGFGRGGGRGFRNRFYATGLFGWQRPTGPLSKEAELGALRTEAESLGKTLAEINERIARLEGKN